MPGGVVREPTAADRQAIRQAYADLGNKTAVSRQTGWHRQTVAAVLARDEPETQPAAAPVEITGQAIPDHSGLVRAGKAYSRIAVLSDLHVPYHDVGNVGAALDYVMDFNPDLIVLNGDLFDCYGISSFDKDPERSGKLQDEFDAAKPLIRQIDGLGADVVCIEGNHEQRLERLIQRNPALSRLRALQFKTAAELPDAWTYLPNQAHYRIGSLSILHGDVRGCGGGIHVAATLLRRLKTSVIFGHWHRTQNRYEPSYDGAIRAAFSSGHLADVRRASEYIVCPEWTPGFISVDYDHGAGCFEVRNHLVYGGKLRANGRTYSA